MHLSLCVARESSVLIKGGVSEELTTHSSAAGCGCIGRLREAEEVGAPAGAWPVLLVLTESWYRGGPCEGGGVRAKLGVQRE